MNYYKKSLIYATELRNIRNDYYLTYHEASPELCETIIPVYDSMIKNILEPVYESKRAIEELIKNDENIKMFI